VEFELGYPELIGPGGDFFAPGPIGKLAAAAEDAGWAMIALTEHPIPGANWLDHGGHQTIDPFVGLAFAAAATTRLRLLTYLAVVPYRNPFLLAKTAATLDRLSDGRFVLGVGTGYQKAEFFALGVDFEERNVLFDEALDVLPLAWSGQPVTYQGRHFNARNVVAIPGPTQQPIPIWIGGNSRLTRRRVAERAQGWMPMFSTPELSSTVRSPSLSGIDELAPMLADLWEMAGDRRSEISVLSDLNDRTIHEPLQDVSRHRDRIAALAEAGLTHISVEAPAGGPEQVYRFLNEFGETYINW
jgi:probable F420-dependent oxidoreductase